MAWSCRRVHAQLSNGSGASVAFEQFDEEATHDIVVYEAEA